MQDAIGLSEPPSLFPSMSDDIPNDILTSDLVKAILAKTGWKQERLAEEMRTSQSQVSRWKTGAAATWDDGVRLIAIARREGALTNGTGTNTLSLWLVVRGQLKSGGLIEWEKGVPGLSKVGVPFPLSQDRFGLLVDAENTSQRARKGDLVVAGPMTSDVSSLIGTEVVLRISGDDFRMGVLVSGRREGTISLLGPSGFVVEDCLAEEAAPYCATIANGQWAPEN